MLQALCLQGRGVWRPGDLLPSHASSVLPHIYLPHPDPIVVAPPPPSFLHPPQASLFPGGLTWAGCTGGSCGNRQPPPCGAAWTGACATRPSWICRGAQSGGRQSVKSPNSAPDLSPTPRSGTKLPILSRPKFRPDSRGWRNTLAVPTESRFGPRPFFQTEASFLGPAHRSRVIIHARHYPKTHPRPCPESRRLHQTPR